MGKDGKRWEKMGTYHLDKWLGMKENLDYPGSAE
jgi:hypothetical protein